MRLHRAHGLGNDYLVYVEGPPLRPDLVRAVCDRHRGVGSDGILEPLPDNGGIAALRIHNPDGSEAEKSGNGLRIFAHYLHHRRGASSSFSVWTAGGVVRCYVAGDRVRVEMGVARVGQTWRFEGLEVLPVDVGNPHAVVFADPPDWRAIGSRLEHAVPGRTNVQFATVQDVHAASARIWERGAGETLSSGSSASAVAAAGVASGRLVSPVSVAMEGGALSISVEDGRVEMEGPVEVVGEIQVDSQWLARR